jgi:transposase
MPHIQGAPRDDVPLFPPSLDEYITDENPVRFIDAFVDQLDLQVLGFTRAVASRLGRPAYHPSDLLKLYIYGYLNRVRSSRLLERETRRNVELMWLLKKLTPDFKTIADFRKDNLQPIQKVFTLLCKELGLFGAELVAIDGSKFKAVNNRKRNFTDEKLTKALAHIDAKIAEYLQALSTADTDTPTRPDLTAAELHHRIAQFRERKQQYQQVQQRLAESGQSQISLTDPDSRSMPVTQGVDICYNVELVVDAKHKLIVTHFLTTDVTDHDQLAPMAKQAKNILGVEELNAVTDKGFYNGEQVKECDQADIQAYIPKPRTSRRGAQGLVYQRRFSL